MVQYRTCSNNGEPEKGCVRGWHVARHRATKDKPHLPLDENRVDDHALWVRAGYRMSSAPAGLDRDPLDLFGRTLPHMQQTVRRLAPAVPV